MTNSDILGVSPTLDGGFQSSARAGRGGQVYGGQVSAQVLAAAARNLPTPSHRIHSLHLTFLSPGDVNKPLVHQQEIIKAGRSFTAVRVDTSQDARLLATSLASFHAPETSDEHGVRASIAVAPEECPAVDLVDIGGNSPVWDVVDARLVSSDSESDTPSMTLWMKWKEPLEDNPIWHSSAVAWMTDLLFVRTSRLKIPQDAPRPPAASLDHTLWFHRQFNANDWLLLESESVVRSQARALGTVKVFDRNGNLVTTSAQETLVR